MSTDNQKIVQLLEFENLLKFNITALENIIKQIEEEVLVVTVIGASRKSQYDIANAIIEKECYFSEKEKGIWICSEIINHQSSNLKVLIMNISEIDSIEFNEKIYTMIHCISSIIIFHTSKPNLSELSFIAKVPKTLTGTNYPEDVLSELSPKFIFLLRKDEDEKNYSNLQKQFDNEKKSAVLLLESLEKEDDYKDIFVKLYPDRKAFIINHYFSVEDIHELKELIFINSFSKSYRGKRNYGLTLRNLFIEFVNCINQKISFNIVKM